MTSNTPNPITTFLQSKRKVSEAERKIIQRRERDRERKQLKKPPNP
jgi:hypothetical protein